MFLELRILENPTARAEKGHGWGSAVYFETGGVKKLEQLKATASSDNSLTKGNSGYLEAPLTNPHLFSHGMVSSLVLHILPQRWKS